MGCCFRRLAQVFTLVIEVGQEVVLTSGRLIIFKDWRKPLTRQRAHGSSVHVAGSKRSTGNVRGVHPRPVQQPVVEQDSVSGRYFQRPDGFWLAILLNVPLTQVRTVDREQSFQMTARHNFNATIRLACWIQRNPESQQRITIKFPHPPSVLVPRKYRSLPSRFVHHHRSEQGKGRMFPVLPVACVKQHWMLNKSAEFIVVLKPLDLSVHQGLFRERGDGFWKILVCATCVELQQYLCVSRGP